MKTARYRGDEIQIGRFGYLRTGDIIRLTKKEAASMQGDKRFRMVRGEDYETQMDKRAAELAEKQRVAREDDEMSREDFKKLLADIARIENLMRENIRAEALEVDELSKEDLLRLCGEIKKRGAPICYRLKHSSMTNLRKQYKLFKDWEPESASEAPDSPSTVTENKIDHSTAKQSLATVDKPALSELDLLPAGEEQD